MTSPSRNYAETYYVFRYEGRLVGGRFLNLDLAKALARRSGWQVYRVDASYHEALVDDTTNPSEDQSGDVKTTPNETV